MSYIDILKRQASKDLPIERSTGDVTTNIGQPSGKKKDAMERYKNLSPERQRRIDQLVLQKRKKTEHYKKVQEQEKRTDLQKMRQSQQATASRLANEKEMAAMAKAKKIADTKQRTADLKAQEKMQKDAVAKQQKIAKANVTFMNSLADFKEADAVFEESLEDDIKKQEWLDNNMIDQANEYSAWENEKARRRQIHDRKQRVVLQKLVRNLMLENDGNVEAVAELMKKMKISQRFQ